MRNAFMFLLVLTASLNVFAVDSTTYSAKVLLNGHSEDVSITYFNSKTLKPVLVIGQNKYYNTTMSPMQGFLFFESDDSLVSVSDHIDDNTQDSLKKQVINKNDVSCSEDSNVIIVIGDKATGKAVYGNCATLK